MLTLPDDREKLRSLDETLRNIISYESDRDVRKVSCHRDSPSLGVQDLLKGCLLYKSARSKFI